MTPARPHYLLFSEAQGSRDDRRWHFVLQPPGATPELDEADHETENDAQRLELLAVVRGLEALDQPSAVTLVTRSDYVRRGLRYGLAHWRADQWQWERFGEMVPVKNVDLWQRLDRAMQYHDVECRTWRIDRPHGTRVAPRSPRRNPGSSVRGMLRSLVARCFPRPFAAMAG